MNMVQCNICNRMCRLGEGEAGICKTRIAKNGKLVSLVYGRVAALHVSPIEIKPLYHYYPGSSWLSVGTLGCNFLCPGCQNWHLSHSAVRDELEAQTHIMNPSELVQLAQDKECKGISFTYNEPSIWLDYTLDVFKLAKEKRLLANYVTNGYMTETSLDLLGAYLDSFRVDLKGFSNETYQKIAKINNLERILENIKRAKFKWGMHVEVITNMMPGFNDNLDEMDAMASWIFKELGKETPWHITRFFPHYKLSHVKATSVSLMEKIYKIGKSKGMEYVYFGNVTGHSYENTYCSCCGKLLIERYNYTIRHYDIADRKCPKCGYNIYGRW